MTSHAKRIVAPMGAAQFIINFNRMPTNSYASVGPRDARSPWGGLTAGTDGILASVRYSCHFNKIRHIIRKNPEMMCLTLISELQQK